MTKIVEIEGTSANLDHEFNQIRQKIGYKADIEDIGRIEDSMRNYVTRDMYSIIL